MEDTSPPKPTKGRIAGTNLTRAHSHNRRTVLQTLRHSGSATRSQIAAATGLTLQTISNITEALIDEQLVIAGRSQSQRNRHGQPYAIDPSGGWTVGVHVARYGTHAVAMDFAGQIIGSLPRNDRPKTPDETAPLMRQLVDELAQTHNLAQERLMGVGLSLPTRFWLGIAERKGQTSFPGWSNAADITRFAESFPYKIIVENDAIAAAIGEKLTGSAQDLSDFVLLYIDEGLGAGVFRGGQPYRGARHAAGEIAHMPIIDGGLTCECGRKGCAERYLSLHSAYAELARLSAAGAPFDASTLTPQRFDTLFAAHGAELTDWFKDAGFVLNRLITLFGFTLDPEAVVISSCSDTPFHEQLIRQTQAQNDPDQTPAQTPLRISSLGTRAAAIGAAALPIYEEYSPRFDALLML